MVSLIRQSFAEQHGLEIQPLEQLVNLRSAGGHVLSYLGYVEARLKIGNYCENALFLVAPCQEMAEQVPVIIGTNILNELVFSEVENESTTWRLAIKGVRLHHESLAREDRVGVLKVTEDMKIKPGEKKLIAFTEFAGLVLHHA